MWTLKAVNGVDDFEHVYVITSNVIGSFKLVHASNTDLYMYAMCPLYVPVQTEDVKKVRQLRLHGSIQDIIE